MFMGEFSHSIDAKGRLIIPAKLREELGDECIVTKGVDGCLTIFTSEVFNRLAEDVKKLDSGKKNVRRIIRFFFGSATKLEFDKQGRVLIPAVLRDHAKLEKEAVIVGANDRLEIWSTEAWDEINDDIGSRIEELTESLDTPISL